MSLSRSGRSTAVIVAAMLLTAACGGGVPVSPLESPSDSPTAGPTGGPTTSPAPAATSEPAGSSPARAGLRTITITGTVQAGVEARCLLLRGYLLIGGHRDVLREGARVRVTGRVAPNVVTTCQQGTPFSVQTAERL